MLLLHNIMFSCCCLGAVVFSGNLAYSYAFTDFPMHKQSTSFFSHHAKIFATKRVATVLNASYNDNGDEQNSSNDDGASIDLNQQKLALENMMKTSDTDDVSTRQKNASSILTSSRKIRLQREIQLVKQLDPDHPYNNSEYSDIQKQELVMSELWALWYGERGHLNEIELRKIEDTLVEPNQWPSAENRYLELIRKHCSTDGSMDKIDLSNWVEPANRLATLLFIMGRYKECKVWCKTILDAKPWHVGALSGVVMVCMKMGDKEGILKYSQMGMPNLSPEMREARRKWVEKNAAVAEKQLLRLEELSKEAYGEPDDTGRNFAEEKPSDGGMAEDSNESEGASDDDAWQ